MRQGGLCPREVIFGTLTMFLMFVLPSPAQAGRNANGALIVHTNDSVNYTSSGDYCGINYDAPDSCGAAGTRTDKDEDTPAVIWFLAAFRPEASPGVTTVQFGVMHNLPSADYFSGYGACGPQPLELPDGGWPFGDGNSSGNLVAYGAAVYSNLFPFYWFAAIGSLPNSYLGSRTYPSTDEAKFVDDGQPPVEDLCHNFGMVAWDGTGQNTCPEFIPPQGACCFEDGSCQVLLQDECNTLGGTYVGDDTVCEPTTCPQPEACCFYGGACEILLPEICIGQQGTPQGPGSVCDPNTCPLPPEACCFDDGSCQFIPPADCAALGGVAQGAGTSCEPNDCPVPTGACCTGDAQCQVTTAADCDAMGGYLFIPGEDCDPNPCPFAARPSTWGQIKANFR